MSHTVESYFMNKKNSLSLRLRIDLYNCIHTNQDHFYRLKIQRRNIELFYEDQNSRPMSFDWIIGHGEIGGPWDGQERGRADAGFKRTWIQKGTQMRAWSVLLAREHSSISTHMLTPSPLKPRLQSQLCPNCISVQSALSAHFACKQ